MHWEAYTGKYTSRRESPDVEGRTLWGARALACLAETAAHAAPMMPTIQTRGQRRARVHTHAATPYMTAFQNTPTSYSSRAS